MEIKPVLKNAAELIPKIIPIVPVASATEGDADHSTQVTSLYVAHTKIHPRSVTGLFARWRWAMVLITQLVFCGLPWLAWANAKRFCLTWERAVFYIFRHCLVPARLYYLTALLVISALSLFLFTAIAGRLWCGYACPQTVYSEIFMWIERKVEGDRSARIRLDGEAMSLEKLVKKWYKHFLWISLSMWSGFTFVGYFTPIRELGMGVLPGPHVSWEVFGCSFRLATSQCRLHAREVCSTSALMRASKCMFEKIP